jgi:endonuclease III
MASYSLKVSFDTLKNRRIRAISIIEKLRIATRGMQQTLSQSIKKEFGEDPFLILISCLLSLRTKDTTTLPICRILFKRAKTPKDLLDVSLSELEGILYKIGFYKNKSEILHSVSRDILKRFNGRVPDSREELLSIKGVGIKTANLVLGEAFGIPAICVDTHVHRISNRLGLINTKTVEQTERALQELLPKKYWIEWNPLIVTWGQNICTPLSPWCSRCAISNLCDRVRVTNSR